MRVNDTVDAVLKQKGSNVWSVSPDATVFEAIRLMADKNVGALVVRAGEELYGVFTERDYTRKVALHGKSSKDTLVNEIISGNLVAVTPADTVEDCLRVMTERRIRNLPVLQGDRLMGIVSIGDLVNWIISAQTVAIDQLQNYITGQYPG